MTSISPIVAGLRCACPACGEGRLFRGYSTFKSRCDACEADLSVAADAGDGPSFFVMFAALIVIVPAAMLLELWLSPPVWVHAIVWPPVTIAFCLMLLRPFRAFLFALQWRHKAGEARFDQADPPAGRT